MPTTIAQLQDSYNTNFNTIADSDRSYYQTAIDFGKRIEAVIGSVPAISPLYLSYTTMTGGGVDDYDFFVNAVDKAPVASKIREYYQLLLINGYVV